MKKILLIVTIFVIIVGTFLVATNVYAAEQVIDEETESKIVEIKDNAAKSLEDYQEKYGSDVYGLVAYILNLVRIYSIPLCFLGIAIGAIHQYVIGIIGIRKLDTLEKGMALIVTFVTILIICQILPLAFAVFVKFGRG